MFFRSTLIAHKTAREPYFMGLVVLKEIITKNIKKIYKTPETACFWGFSLPIAFSRTSRYVVGIFVNYFCTLDNHIIEIISFLAIPGENLWYNMEKYY